MAKRVHRGGSFLCTDQYCSRYMVGTRGKGEVTTGANHLGFRTVLSLDSRSSIHRGIRAVIAAQLMPNDSALMQRVETLIYQALDD